MRSAADGGYVSTAIITGAVRQNAAYRAHLYQKNTLKFATAATGSRGREI